MIKVLAGYHEPDPGARSSRWPASRSASARRRRDHAGLRFVHQDLGLVPTLDASDNLAMGHGYERNRLGLISWRREARLTRKTLRISATTSTSGNRPVIWSSVERTAIALARALSPRRRRRARLLVLDEPTANLPAAEIERLFGVVRARPSTAA